MRAPASCVFLFKSWETAFDGAIARGIVDVAAQLGKTLRFGDRGADHAHRFFDDLLDDGGAEARRACPEGVRPSGSKPSKSVRPLMVRATTAANSASFPENAHRWLACSPAPARRCHRYWRYGSPSRERAAGLHQAIRT